MRLRRKRKYECLCGHLLTNHARMSAGMFGPCNARVWVRTTQSSASRWEECRCLQYIGEVPPEDLMLLLGSG